MGIQYWFPTKRSTIVLCCFVLSLGWPFIGNQVKGQASDQQAEIDWVMLLPDEPGKELVVAECGTCHSLGKTVVKAQSKDEWYGTVGLMGGEYAAQFREQDVDGIVEYLSRFAGEKNPLTQIPMDINTASVEALKRLRFLGEEDIEKILQYRTKDKFKSIEEVQKLVKIDPKKLELIPVYLQVR